MTRFIDSLLNKVTMYWLTLNVLRCFIGAAVILSFFGLLHYSFIDILLDAFIAVNICWLSNIFLAKLFHAIPNKESAHITALILALIIPPQFPTHIAFLAIASFLAMLSKYLLTIDKRHIFNPAALAVAAIALVSNNNATWWIGTPVMLPFVLAGGLLIARKIQRGKMLCIFFFTYFFVTGLSAFFHTGINGVLTAWKAGILDSAVFFFGFIMLTEPITSPATKTKRKWYALLTALLFTTPNLRLGTALTPEMALCVGNIFSYFISPNYRLVLSLVDKKIVGSVGIFSFAASQKISYLAGQYMEWTLPHKNADSRGNRRYFSIGSSPTESELLLTVKFYSPSSSYKNTLHNLQKGDSIIAAQLSGDFVLPKDITQPLAFIAGGVGIVPYRAMIKYIVDKKLQTNIVLLYAEHSEENIVFRDIFTEAEKYGVQTIYFLTDANHNSQGKYINNEVIAKEIPDFKKRIFYLSGPQLMVERYASTLRHLGLPYHQIIQDFFPGYQEK